jgi:hypothetical protein
VLAAEAIGIFLPGVGPVLVLGTVATALAALAGTLGGIEVGSVVENALTTGVPKDEMFVYEDALRKGRTVLIVLADDHAQAAQAHRLLQQAGAESIDAARDQWWLGLRSAEQAVYAAQGGDFVNSSMPTPVAQSVSGAGTNAARRTRTPLRKHTPGKHAGSCRTRVGRWHRACEWWTARPA